MNKKSKNNQGIKKGSVKYCTECGEKLNDFCFSEELQDLDALKEHHEICKATNKFKGDVCSRLFIATPVEIK